MKNSRTFNVKRNIFSGFINKIASLGLPFFIRTIIIHKLGAEYLGLNSLFASILQVLNMAELGFSSAITYRMYKPMASNDIDTVCALMAFYRNVYKIIGISIMIAGLFLMPCLKLLIKGSYPDEISIYLLYFIYLINTSISYLFFSYKSVLLNVAQRQDILSNIDTILLIVRSIFQIIVLLIYNNYYLYLVWNPVATLVNNIAIAVITSKYFPEYICRGKLPENEIRDIRVQIKGLVIGKIGNVSRNSFDSIILSAFLGLVEVAIYSNYYYILAAVLGIITIVIQAMTAGVGNSIATESKEKNYDDFKKFNFYFSWIGSWCTICLLCLYQPFMQIWVGKRLMAPFITVILFCIYFYVSQMGQVRSAYSTASGIWWEFRYLFIGEMFTNIILNLEFGRLFGMNGIIISTIITVFSFSVIGIGKKTINIYFGRSSGEYFCTIIVYMIVTFFVGSITYIMCSQVQGDIYIVLILRIIICCIIPNGLFLILAIRNQRLRYYLQQVILIVKIKQ